MNCSQNLSLSPRVEYEEIIEGEMLRYKKSDKELSIARWCVLSAQSFRYYKGQFSSMCDEKPLFTLATACIRGVKAMAFNKSYAIEIEVDENEFSASLAMSKASLKSNASAVSERHLMNKPRYFEPRQKIITRPNLNMTLFTRPIKSARRPAQGVRENKSSWTTRENLMYLTEERLIFIVPTKSDWEKWQIGFKTLAKVEITRD